MPGVTATDLSRMRSAASFAVPPVAKRARSDASFFILSRLTSSPPSNPGSTSILKSADEVRSLPRILVR